MGGFLQNSQQPITNLFTNSTYRSLLIASPIPLIFAIGLGILLSRTVIRPLRALEQLTMEVFEVAPILLSVTQRFGPAAESKGVALTLNIANPSPKVWADQDCLTHILNNLIDNALRYTPQGGEISISAQPKHGQI